MTDYINVVLIDFNNTTVPATSTVNDDGGYTIFINSRMSADKQKDSYIHELQHILKMDFEAKHTNVDMLEACRHMAG